MDPLLLLTIALRAAAIGWAAYLWAHHRDWRLGIFFGLIGLLSMHEAQAIRAAFDSRDRGIGGFDALRALFEAGAALGAVGVVAWIVHARAHAARRLQMRDDLFSIAEDVAHVGSWTWDVLTGEVQWSDGMHRMHGMPPRTLEPSLGAAFDLIHPDDRDKVSRHIRRCIDNRRFDPVEYRIIRADGEERVLVSHGVAEFDGDEAVRMYGSAQDITERSRAEEAIRLRDRAIQAATSGIIITDAQAPGNPIIFCNEAFTRLTGYTEAEAVGRNCRFLQHGATDHGALDEIRAAVSEQRPCTVVLRNRRKDGSQFWNELTISPVRDDSGRLTHFVGVQNDVSARVESQQRLKEARDEAVEASRRRGAFLARMSHEIRTPMTAILGYADLLLDPDVSETQRTEHINTIRRSGGHLLTLLNDILDFSKIEAEQVSPERIATCVPRIALDVATLLRPRADARGVSLEVVMKTPTPDAVLTDPTRLRQILMNLVSNAVKFTEQGGVRIEIEADRGAADGIPMRIRVVDTGIGMTPEQTQRVFDPFAQGDGDTTRRFGGTGLGLAISRRLAHILGGDISVQSRAGGGSAFTLAFTPGAVEGAALVRDANTCRESEIRRELPLDTPECEGRVLLVEDTPESRRLFVTLLQRAGIDVSSACDGREALDAVEHATAQAAPFDLVFMDIQMPVMDGIEATRELRARGFNRPIIALTANAMAGDREACIEAGCDDYLPKPLERAMLYEACARWLGAPRSRAA